jgi:murein DD-endopeptidase MepM/ murein hydrolase activator NlpD
VPRRAGRPRPRREAARRAARNARVYRAPSRNTSNGALAYPVSAPISSEFGMRFHPILNYWRLHAGIDFSAECGAPVYAAGAGEVIQAGWAGGYGNAIVIAHNDSLATTYNHLSSIVVGGGSVARGQLIGYVGTTGLSTGCHLHFETRVEGNPVNPRGYL